MVKPSPSSNSMGWKAVMGLVKLPPNIGVSSNNCVFSLTFGAPLKSTVAFKSFGTDTAKPPAPNSWRTLDSEGMTSWKWQLLYASGPENCSTFKPYLCRRPPGWHSAMIASFTSVTATAAAVTVFLRLPFKCVSKGSIRDLADGRGGVGDCEDEGNDVDGAGDLGTGGASDLGGVGDDGDAVDDLGDDGDEGVGDSGDIGDDGDAVDDSGSDGDEGVGDSGDIGDDGDAVDDSGSICDVDGAGDSGNVCDVDGAGDSDTGGAISLSLLPR